MTTGPATPPNYGLNSEVIDSYRRTIVFNNSLLLQQYDQRYDFKTQEEERKMRYSTMLSKPASEEQIQKYLRSRADNKEKRRLTYEKRLNDNVEKSVRNYAMGIRSLLMMD